jgi:hypothetical protein
MPISPTRRLSTVPRVRLLPTVLLAVVLLFSLLSTSGASAAQGGDSGEVSADVRLTYRVFNELFAGSSTSSADLIAATATLTSPMGEFTGPAGFDAFLAAMRGPFRDLRFAVSTVTPYGNETYGQVVIVQWTLTGHVGLASAPVVLDGMSVLTMGNGMVVRHGISYDAIALASQIETAQYTEMELARSGAPGQSAPPVAGVREEPVSAPTVVPGEVTPPNGHPR